MTILLSILLISASQAKELVFNYNWENTPSIEICPDANVKEEKIKEAIEFWKSEGLNINVKNIKLVEACNPNSRNVIQIMGDRDVKTYEYAATVIDWYYYGSKDKNTVYYINRAKVQIPEETQDKIIFHEIGHAFGLGHSHHEVMYAYH